MEQKNAGKKKGSRGVSRKSFIIGIIALCLVALIAEVVLLVHGFSKKTEKKQPEQVTPTQVVKNDSTPTPTATAEPTPTPEVDHYESVWKLAKEYKTGSQGQKNPVCYMEYDEQGRESKRIVFDEDLGTPKETDVFHYDRSGITLVDRYVPSEENGELTETVCFHAPSSESILFFPDYYLDFSISGETVILAERDPEGNLVTLTSSSPRYWDETERSISEWEISPDGVLKSMRISDTAGMKTYTFQYDDSGRPISRTIDPSPEGNLYQWGFVYENGRIYHTVEGNGVFTFVYEDGELLSFTRLMGSILRPWPGAVTISEDDYSCTELEKGIIYRPKGNIWSYDNNVNSRYPYDAASLLCVDEVHWDANMSKTQAQSVDIRSDGQPIYADGFQHKYYEYDNTGRLTRYHTTPNDVDILTELDENWNLVKKTDLINNVVYEYEWILIDVPVYE